ncbi:MAG: hypothetical protein ACRDTC_26715 [Pseudonocardiaceae bacterium]
MYRLITHDQAREQVATLAAEALPGYAETLGVMKLVPWNSKPLNEANPDRPVRQLVFGPGGYGLVTYLIMERDRRVDVLEVQWAGE